MNTSVSLVYTWLLMPRDWRTRLVGGYLHLAGSAGRAMPAPGARSGAKNSASRPPQRCEGKELGKDYSKSSANDSMQIGGA